MHDDRERFIPSPDARAILSSLQVDVLETKARLDQAATAYQGALRRVRDEITPEGVRVDWDADARCFVEAEPPAEAPEATPEETTP